jgi:hypothetical protein
MNMKRAFTLIAGSALALSSVSAMAAPAHSYLYAITGTHGVIKTLNNNNYELSITLSKTNQVTMFSDRPYRIVKPISGLELKKRWSQGGSNSFAANPPNGILEIANNASEVVTFTHFQINGRQAIYTFSAAIAGTKIPNSWTKGHNHLAHLTID